MESRFINKVISQFLREILFVRWVEILQLKSSVPSRIYSVNIAELRYMWNTFRIVSYVKIFEMRDFPKHPSIICNTGNNMQFVYISSVKFGFP